MNNFSFEPLKLKLATNNIIIPMENGVADLTNAETSAKIMLAGKELFPVFDERIEGRNFIPNSLNRIVLASNEPSQHPIEDQSVAGMDYRRFRRTYPDGITDTRVSTYTREFFTPEKSGNYVYSTYFRPNDFDIELRLRIGGTYGKYTLCKAGEWTRVSVVAFIDKGQSIRLTGVYGDMPQESVQWIDYNRVIVVSGNKATDWTPAPEDVLQLATLSSYNCSAAIVGDLIKITSHKPGTTRGWVDVTVNYGNLSNTKRLNWSVEGVEPYKPLGTLLTMNNRGIKY